MPEENDPYHATWPPSIEPEHDPLCPISSPVLGYRACHCDLIAKVRADERDKFMEEARSDIAAAILINEARADEREKIAIALAIEAEVARANEKN